MDLVKHGFFHRKQVYILWLIVNLAFIWGNSLLPGTISGAISDFIGSLLAQLGGKPQLPGAGRGLLRKLAHLSEFTLLGIGLVGFFRSYTPSRKHPQLPALLCGFLAACADETIQCFVPNRGPALKDVGIDTLGVALGIVFISLIKEKKT